MLVSGYYLCGGGPRIDYGDARCDNMTDRQNIDEDEGEDRPSFTGLMVFKVDFDEELED